MYVRLVVPEGCILKLPSCILQPGDSVVLRPGSPPIISRECDPQTTEDIMGIVHLLQLDGEARQAVGDRTGPVPPQPTRARLRVLP